MTTTIVVRALSTACTVLISVVIAAEFGDSGAGRVLAAFVIAVFVCLVELLLVFAPKHWSFARHLIDRRSKLEGIWVQEVSRVVSGDEASAAESNRFAVFWIEYQSGDYRVRGHAFDAAGIEVARWGSTDPPTFDSAGTVMSYVFEGEFLGESTGDVIDRTGVTRLDFDDDLTTGTGRADHVGLSRILLFSIERVTSAFLEMHGSAMAPNDVKSAGKRAAFGVAYARSLADAPNS